MAPARPALRVDGAALCAVRAGLAERRRRDHYSLLASIEDMFGLRRLGEANLPGTTTFGPDVFTAAP
jgi:hypothetical protein